MPFKVVQLMDKPGSFMPDYGDMIRQAGFDVEFSKTNCETEDEIIAAAADADVVIGVATFQPFTRKVIESLTRCRFIMSLGIGFDNLDVQAATDHGILAANVPDYCQEEMSDHAMALILAIARKITKLDNFVKQGKWILEPEPEIQMQVWPTMIGLRDKTLGLIGFGRIARKLVPKAKGFGMRVIAYDPYLDESAVQSAGAEKVNLDDLLAQADVLSLHCALTNETWHMLGAEQFEKMKPSAIVVNTARGGLIDQPALYQALTTAQIGGAGLDVTDPEPIRLDDPLLKLENVTITPHSAHASIPALMALLQRPGEEVARVLKGERPVGLLNLQAEEKYRERCASIG